MSDFDSNEAFEATVATWCKRFPDAEKDLKKKAIKTVNRTAFVKNFGDKSAFDRFELSLRRVVEDLSITTSPCTLYMFIQSTWENYQPVEVVTPRVAVVTHAEAAVNPEYEASFAEIHTLWPNWGTGEELESKSRAAWVACRYPHDSTLAAAKAYAVTYKDPNSDRIYPTKMSKWLSDSERVQKWASRAKKNVLDAEFETIWRNYPLLSDHVTERAGMRDFWGQHVPPDDRLFFLCALYDYRCQHGFQFEDPSRRDTEYLKKFTKFVASWRKTENWTQTACDVIDPAWVEEYVKARELPWHWGMYGYSGLTHTNAVGSCIDDGMNFRQIIQRFCKGYQETALAHHPEMVIPDVTREEEDRIFKNACDRVRKLLELKPVVIS